MLQPCHRGYVLRPHAVADPALVLRMCVAATGGFPLIVGAEVLLLCAAALFVRRLHLAQRPTRTPQSPKTH